jgi:hypothetical protein
MHDIVLPKTYTDWSVGDAFVYEDRVYLILSLETNDPGFARVMDLQDGCKVLFGMSDPALRRVRLTIHVTYIGEA